MRARWIAAGLLLSSSALAQTPTPVATATATASPDATPAATATATPEVTATPEASATPIATATPEATPAATPAPTATPTEFTTAPQEYEQVDEGGIRNIPPTREASGTSWQPDTVPMRGYHAKVFGWQLMAHGTIYGGYLRQNDPDNPYDRGGETFASMNHVMGMARRDLAGGDLALRAMFSLEPFTTPEEGYPLSAQSGEVFEGEAIHDRQHAHDLFMELAALYSVPLGRDVGLQLYAAPAGEPALGPVAFPHRVSAQASPLSPLSHHWQDSTHIAFGVATAALYTRYLKVEGSAFNGREPDEDRLDIEFPGIDSWSGRVQFMPMRELVVQASYGYLRSPEELEPGRELRKWTASMLYSRPMGEHGGNASMAVIWGQNDAGHHGATAGFTVEAELAPDRRNAFFVRGENVRKEGHDLGFEADLGREIYDVTGFSAGYVHELGTWAGVSPALGILGTMVFVDPALEPLYETDAPKGFMVFFRLRPGEHRMGAAGGHHGHH